MTISLALYNNFIQSLVQGQIDISTDSIKAILCSSTYTPNLSTHTTLSDITGQLSTAYGYTQNTKALTGYAFNITDGIGQVTFDDVTWTASGGSIGPARYLVLYDDTADDKLVGYVDFGADKTAADGSEFKITWVEV